MALDLGDVWATTFYTRDSAGVLAAPGALPAGLVTKPDATTTAATVALTATGTYRLSYTTATAGRHTVSVSWSGGSTVAGVYTDVFDVTDATLLPLVGFDELKARLKITSTLSATDEDTLRSVLDEATDLAERYCNRAFRRRTVVEIRDGGTKSLTLFQAPVLSVTTVVEGVTTLAATDYTLNGSAGILYRGPTTSRLTWASGTQSVTVTYVAGYTDPPAAAVRGVKDIAAYLWQTTQQGARPAFGQSSEGVGFGTDAMPSWVYRPLDSLILPGFA